MILLTKNKDYITRSGHRAEVVLIHNGRIGLAVFYPENGDTFNLITCDTLGRFYFNGEEHRLDIIGVWEDHFGQRN